VRARLALAFLAACAACVVGLLVARSHHAAALPIEADRPHPAAIPPHEAPAEKQPSPAAPPPLVDRTAPEIESLEPGDGASVDAGPLMMHGRVREDDLASAVAGSARCAIVGRSFACSVELVAGPQVFRVALVDRTGNAHDTLLHLEGRPEAVAHAVALSPAVVVDPSDETPARDIAASLGATSERVASVPVLDPSVTLPEEADAPAEIVDEDDDKPPPPYPGLRALGPNVQGYDVFERIIDGARVIRIPGGTFTMGSEDRDAALLNFVEAPHPATVRPFLIDECEVTYAQWVLYAGATRQAGPMIPASRTPSHPMTAITWRQAGEFCRWTGGRLPTEAEWELAARGKDGREYPWGSQWPPPPMTTNTADATWLAPHPWYVCCFVAEYNDGQLETAPVGSFPAGASPFGALDMAGNVTEWCSDNWGEAAGAHVLRGGSYSSYAFTGDVAPRTNLRAVVRDYERETVLDDWVGCRCAQDAPAPAPPPSEP
jgi:formylglycine-generating enzyme required for sulfatase activity